jgi:hypothetical protein
VPGTSGGFFDADAEDAARNDDGENDR